MRELVTVREFARIRYGVDEPTKAQMNTIAGMCQRGAIRHAGKVGRTWLINIRKELPECFA